MEVLLLHIELVLFQALNLLYEPLRLFGFQVKLFNQFFVGFPNFVYHQLQLLGFLILGIVGDLLFRILKEFLDLLVLSLQKGYLYFISLLQLLLVVFHSKELLLLQGDFFFQAQDLLFQNGLHLPQVAILVLPT